MENHLKEIPNSLTQWHKKLGYGNPERTVETTKIFETMPKFFRRVFNEFSCTDCLIPKAKSASSDADSR